MRSDIVPETVFPDYELPDHTAKRRKLSERAHRWIAAANARVARAAEQR